MFYLISSTTPRKNISDQQKNMEGKTSNRRRTQIV